MRWNDKTYSSSQLSTTLLTTPLQRSLSHHLHDTHHNPATRITTPPRLTKAMAKRHRIPDTTGVVRQPLPPLSWESTCDDMVRHLKHLHERYGAHGDDWHFVDHPFGFKDAQTKRNWSLPGDPLDTRGLYTYTDFLRQPYAGGAQLKIGLFCTWTKSWVGRPEWHKDEAW